MAVVFRKRLTVLLLPGRSCCRPLLVWPPIMQDQPTLLLHPLLLSILQIILLMVLGLGLSWVLSTGSVSTGNTAANMALASVTGVKRTVEFSNEQWYMISLPDLPF